MAEVVINVKATATTGDAAQKLRKLIEMQEKLNKGVHIKASCIVDGLKDIEKIATEQTKAAEKAAKASSKINSSSSNMQLVASTKEANKAIVELASSYSKAKAGSDGASASTEQLSTNIRDAASQAGQAAQSVGDFSSSLDDFLNRVRSRLTDTVISGAIRAVVSAFKSAAEEIKNVDTALVSVRKTSDKTSEELESIGDRAYDAANKFGIAASNYLQLVADFNRAGLKDDAEKLASLAEKTAIAGEMDTDAASKMLIAINKAYDLSAQQLSSVVDGLNELDNNYATTIEDITEGLGKVSSIASQAGVSVAELSAAIGTITSTTQRSGTEAATALRAIFLNIIGDTTTEIEEGATWTAGEIAGMREVVLKYAGDVKKAADETGKVLNPMEVMRAFHEAYEDGALTQAKLLDELSDIGGKLRTSQLLALIQNWDEYESQLYSFNNALGSVDEEIAKYLDSYDAKINQLKNSWTDFVSTLTDTKLIKGAIDEVSYGLQTVDNTLEGLMTILDGAISWITAGFADKLFDNTTGVFETLARLSNEAKKQVGSWFNPEEYIKQSSDSSTEITKTIARMTQYTKGSEEFVAASKSVSESLGVVSHNVRSTDEAIEILISHNNDLIKVAEKERNVSSNFKAYNKALKEAVSTVEGVSVNEDAFGSIFLEPEDDSTEGVEKYRKSLESLIKAAKEAYGENSELYKGLEDALENYNVKLQAEANNALLEAMKVEGLPETEEEAIAFAKTLEGLTDSEAAYNEALEQTIALLPAFADVLREAEKGLDDAALEKSINSLGDLSSELSGASDAIDKFNKAKSSEKGDSFESFYGMYKSAKSLFKKGMYGSNEYQAAMDALYGADFIKEKYKGDYEAAGRELGEGAGAEFYKAMFSGKGKDYGIKALQYLYKEIQNSPELADAISIEKVDGEFQYVLHDMDKFCNLLKISKDSVWSLIDMWGIFDGTAEYTNNQIDNILTALGDGIYTVQNDVKNINIDNFLEGLAEAGRSAKDVDKIVEDIQKKSKSYKFVGEDGFELDTSDIEKKLAGYTDLLNEATGESESKVTFVEEGWEELKTIFGSITSFCSTVSTKIVEIRTRHIDEYVSSGSSGRIFGRYSGVKNSSGETALVNDEAGGYNPELIVDNGMAYIAGGGYPTVVKLHKGATVYTADETRAIMSRSKNGTDNIEFSSYAGGASGGGIPTRVPTGNTGTKENKNGSSAGSSSTKSEEQTWWKQLKEYVSELQEDADDVIEEQTKKTEEQTALIDEQIETLKKEKEMKEDEEELEEKKKKVLEAQNDLLDAQTNKTVRYFNKMTNQWEWMADAQSVADAEEALAEAQKDLDDLLYEREYDAKIDALEAEKDALEKQLDALEEHYKNLEDLWSDISDEIQDFLDGMNNLDLTSILSGMSGSTAASEQSGLESWLTKLSEFINNPTGSYDNGGIASGKGLLKKAIKANEVVLGASLSSSVLNPTSNAQFETFTESLERMFGVSNASSSIVNNRSAITNNNGGNTYINGVNIGSEMVDKPLSEILSVLPIYSN